MKVNLISDTITVPSKGMLNKMFNAKVGDDIFRNDPTTLLLEEKVASMFGMEAALFFPSGTMSNQAALKYHTNPGEQLICDHFAHIYNYESGGISFNSGVSCKLIQGNRGMITAPQVAQSINIKSYILPKTTLVCVENTTNKGGGACYDFKVLKEIKKVCVENKLAFHLDGARLWNALLETSAKPKEYGAIFDTISLCFSKGLGAPIGSILLGTKEAMREILRTRKQLGGGMRQVGYLAAAALYAIENQWEEMRKDHKRAKEIEVVLSKCEYVKEIAPVETNIIIFTLTDKIDETKFLEILQGKNITLTDMGSQTIRIVTHRDYTEEQHQYFIDVLKNLEI